MFELLQDEMYFAKIEPDFNVLPLIQKHFKDRYADQKWMIFDLKRNFGIIYDLKNAEFLFPDETQLQNFRNSEQFHHEEEKKISNTLATLFRESGNYLNVKI